MATDPTHHFVFDLDTGIRLQVVEALEKSPMLALATNAGPQDSGIYVLYLLGKLVYVGKASKNTTKSGRTLRVRLNEHAAKISGRQHIKLEKVGFRYLTFDSEWWVFAAEYVLISYFKPDWNGSGFGSKAPGKGRPGTHRLNLWNEQYPPAP